MRRWHAFGSLPIANRRYGCDTADCKSALRQRSCALEPRNGASNPGALEEHHQVYRPSPPWSLQVRPPPRPENPKQCLPAARHWAGRSMRQHAAQQLRNLLFEQIPCPGKHPSQRTQTLLGKADLYGFFADLELNVLRHCLVS